MTRSKLEIYLDIIKTIVIQQQLTLARLKDLLNVNELEISDCLNFLVNQKIINKLVVDGSNTLSASLSGEFIVSYFGLIDKRAPKVN